MGPTRLTLTVLLAAASSVLAQAPPAAADLAARIQARYASVRDFTADFTQTQTSAISRGTYVDRGKVAVKKPGRMRWVTSTGSRSELVADGSQLYFYLPKDKIVQVSPMPKDSQASTALLLLAGRGDLTRDFTPDPDVERGPNDWRLTLMPAAPQPDFKTLTLAVDRSSLQLRGLTVVDAQGGVQRFEFSNLRENQGLPDSTFAFTIPKGVEVRRAGTQGQPARPAQVP
ncbi:MAG: outer membrane lipoprotein chaperone LolA [Acidobacteria bacterium]|nr:outer membrane lipoprotein chaperone LolA [Acidobacteriota bacterium]